MHCALLFLLLFAALLYFGSLSLSLPLVVACEFRVLCCVCVPRRLRVSPTRTRPEQHPRHHCSLPSRFAFLPLSSFPPSLSMSSTLTVTQTRASSAPSPSPVPSVAQSGPTPVHIQVDGDWYDLTHWKKQHPGGALILEQMHGNDATGQIHANTHRRKTAQLDATRMQACTPRRSNTPLC